ncbi:MAG TPA: monovalent cation/H(+) antiporter subunit G [Egibacteraceae bacterium]|nr:monovalent cation/H(+) antiporter subunit G [Egibacteraceae bacterium]
MSAAEVLLTVLVLTGAGLTLVATVGLHRFPDVFARMHSATKSATLGLLLILVATAFALGDAASTAKIALVAVLQFVTAPVAAHMIGRAAYAARTELSPDTQLDELAESGLLPPLPRSSDGPDSVPPE